MTRAFFRGSKLHIIGPASRTRLKLQEMEEASDWYSGFTSSNVKAICWRAGEGGRGTGLGVWFDPKDKNGVSTGKQVVYWYPAATYDVYLSVKHAPSKGEAVHAIVIRRYPHLGPFEPGD